MADDQVKYSDLIAQDVQPGLTMLAEALKAVAEQIASLKTEATALKGAMSAAGTATREQQQATAQQTASVEGLSKKVKQLTEEERRLEEVRKRYKKLTDEQIERVNAFQQALRGSTQQQMAAVNAIDVETKSYNELNAMYNALKDSLNAMTVAERQNTEAGKAMTVQSAKIYDTMNELQKATGKYTLQVGKYRAAFDGLGYSMQQIIREVPSALDVNQFFLAISNNIPMFLDQFKAFKEEQGKVKEQMQDLVKNGKESSEEYEKLSKRVETFGGKLKRTIFSWQTAIMGVIMILRSYGNAIGDWFTELFSSKIPKVQKQLMELNSTMAEASKNYMSQVTELNMLIERMSGLTRGSDAYRDVVERINEITGETFDYLKDEPDMIREITNAYIDQQIKLANNAAIVERLTKTNILKNALQNAYGDKYMSSKNFASYLKPFIEDVGELSYVAQVGESIKTLNDALREGYMPKAVSYSLPVNQLDDWFSMAVRSWGEFFESPLTVGAAQFNNGAGAYTVQGYEGWARNAGGDRVKMNAQQRKKMEEQKEKYEKYLENLLEKYGYLTSDVVDKLMEGYDTSAIENTLRKKKSGDGKTPKDSRVSGSFNNSYRDMTKADVLVEEANAMSDKGDTVLQTIQMWYDKRVAITNAAYEKEKETLDKEREERNKSLTDNLLKAEQFKSKYDALVAEVDKDPYLDDEGKAARKAELKNQLDEATKLIESASVQRGNIKKYYDERELIAEQKKQNELADLDKQRTEKLFKEEERRFKARQDADKRRFDLEKHNSIEQAKFNMEQEIASKNWQIDHAKELQLSEEQLAVLKEEVEWLNKKYNQGNYNAKRGNTGNYSNIMDVLFGEKITSDQVSALNSVFDQAKEALNSWMDARKAAADQAKELADDEVSAAENALNREIELRNQGYANDVALREKELADAKEKQKKAVELQAKYKKEQVLLDAAMQASSMITASANIFKQFPIYVAIPMLATLWGAFGYAKVQAYQAAEKSVQFKEGGVMLLEGGSHESGHDVNLGIGPDGSNLRAEGGEYFAVINKRSSRKYGSQIPAVVNALNSGMFEDRYIKTSDAMGLMGNVGVVGNVGDSADLSRLESGVGELVKQGESRWSTEGEWRVMRYKNLTRRVRIS